MDRTLSQVISTASKTTRFRKALHNSSFFKDHSILDVLDDPRYMLECLRGVPHVGELSIARIKKIISTELERTFPQEWAASENPAHRNLAKVDFSDDIDHDVLKKLRVFRKTWDYSSESFDLSGKFHPKFKSPANTVFTAPLTALTPFTYIPESLPEIVKTPAVFRAELGWSEENEDYLGRLKSALSDIAAPPKGSLVLLDVRKLGDLVEARGSYQSLTREDVVAQMEILSDVFGSDRAPETIVCDLRKHGLSSGYASQKGPLFQYCFGGYLELHSNELLDHFHQLAHRAAQTGTPLLNWLETYGSWGVDPAT